MKSVFKDRVERRQIGLGARDLPRLDRPRGNEPTEAIAPDVLINRDCDKQAASDWFIAVHCIGAHDGRDSRNLDASTRIADDDNGFPWP